MLQGVDSEGEGPESVEALGSSGGLFDVDVVSEPDPHPHEVAAEPDAALLRLRLGVRGDGEVEGDLPLDFPVVGHVGGLRREAGLDGADREGREPGDVVVGGSRDGEGGGGALSPPQVEFWGLECDVHGLGPGHGPPLVDEDDLARLGVQDVAAGVVAARGAGDELCCVVDPGRLQFGLGGDESVVVAQPQYVALEGGGGRVPSSSESRFPSVMMFPLGSVRLDSVRIWVIWSLGRLDLFWSWIEAVRAAAGMAITATRTAIMKRGFSLRYFLIC